MQRHNEAECLLHSGSSGKVVRWAYRLYGGKCDMAVRDREILMDFGYHAKECGF